MKKFLKKYIGDLYFTPKFFIFGAIVVTLMVIRFFTPFLSIVPFVALFVFVGIFIVEYALLFIKKNAIIAERTHSDRFSNGDENEVKLYIENRYFFPVQVDVIDEIPVQFQNRNVHFHTKINSYKTSVINYTLRPVKRGNYGFGDINVYISAYTKFIERRVSFPKRKEVSVYPSFLQMRKYRLMAMNNRLSEAGLKKQRRIGHSMEFEHIKDYVTGDDYRTINWKATARKGGLMVNNYVEEKSQPVYCVIDKGRLMEMAFDGLSLLDYSINASLVLSSIAIQKEDKAGIVTFSDKMGALLPADKRAYQMQKIQEVLYHQKTRYLESDFEKLYTSIRNKISQRSLVLLFTNFASLNGMKRQKNYLKKIAESHLLVVIFFQNTEMVTVLEKEATNVKDIYTQTIVEQFEFEKKQIVSELKQAGILTILTSPQNLTVNVLNKYLEIKARQLL